MRKTVIAAAAAFAVASGAMIGQASAADLFFDPPAPPPPVFVPTWAGFYIGGHIGYGEADFDHRQDFDIWLDNGNNDGNGDFYPNSFSRTLNPNGLVGGVQGGYNWQAGSMVFGLEGDISFTDWSERSNVFDSDFDTVGGLLPRDDAFGVARADVDFLASLRGRVGFAMNNFLLYGTGGVAWADANARATIVHYDGIADTETEWTGSRNFNDVGFVLGAGMGWMVIPQTFSVGVEGLYYFFDKRKTLIDDTFEYAPDEWVDVRATAKLDDAWVIRARADFHF